MPVLIAILGIIGAAYFWTQRARNARDMLAIWPMTCALPRAGSVLPAR